MNRSSKNILEALLFKVPNIRYIYDLLDLGTITSSEHPEYSNIVSNFSDPDVILCIGLVTTCIIVQREQKNKYHCIVIGSDVYYIKCNKGDLYKISHDTMLAKDYIPQPLSKKIAFISSYDRGELYGNVYTEILSRRYTTKVVNNLVETAFLEKDELLSYFDLLKENVNNIKIVNEES